MQPDGIEAAVERFLVEHVLLGLGNMRARLAALEAAEVAPAADLAGEAGAVEAAPAWPPGDSRGGTAPCPAVEECAGKGLELRLMAAEIGHMEARARALLFLLRERPRPPLSGGAPLFASRRGLTEADPA